MFAVGSVQSAGTGELPVDPVQGGGDLPAGDPRDVSRAQDSHAAEAQAAETGSRGTRRKTQTDRRLIDAAVLISSTSEEAGGGGGDAIERQFVAVCLLVCRQDNSNICETDFDEIFPLDSYRLRDMEENINQSVNQSINHF